jgi:hypothetical protein
MLNQHPLPGKRFAGELPRDLSDLARHVTRLKQSVRQVKHGGGGCSTRTGGDEQVAGDKRVAGDERSEPPVVNEAEVNEAEVNEAEVNEAEVNQAGSACHSQMVTRAAWGAAQACRPAGLRSSTGQGRVPLGGRAARAGTDTGY